MAEPSLHGHRPSGPDAQLGGAAGTTEVLGTGGGEGCWPGEPLGLPSGSCGEGGGEPTASGSEEGSGAIVRDPLAVRWVWIAEGPASAAGLAGMGVTVMVAAAGRTSPGAERTSPRGRGVGVVAG